MSSFKEFIQEATKSDPVADKIYIADRLVSFLKGKPEGRGCDRGDTQDAENHGGQVVASLRYWGNWVTPPDADDDEDYDWQELSKESSTKLKAYVDEFKKTNASTIGNYHISVGTGEKNWLEIEVK